MQNTNYLIFLIRNLDYYNSILTIMGNMIYSTKPADEPVSETVQDEIMIDFSGEEEKSYADAIKHHDRGYPKITPDTDTVTTNISNKITVIRKKNLFKSPVVRQSRKARRRHIKFSPIPESYNPFDELTHDISCDQSGSDEWNKITSRIDKIRSPHERVNKINYLGYKISDPNADTYKCLVNVENTLPSIKASDITGTSHSHSIHLSGLDFKLPVYRVVIYDTTGEREKQVFDDFYISSDIFTTTKVNGCTGEFMDNNLGDLAQMPTSWDISFKLPYKTVNFSSSKLGKITISGKFIPDHTYLVKYWNYNYAILGGDVACLKYDY
jgi:hypothetical protein